MSISLNSVSLEPNLEQGGGVVVAQLAKQQQIAEGKIALQLIQAAALPAEVSTPQPQGSLGNHVDVTV